MPIKSSTGLKKVLFAFLYGTNSAIFRVTMVSLLLSLRKWTLMKIGQNLVIIVSFKPLFAQKIEVRKKGEKMDLQVCRVVTFSTPLLMTLQSSRHLPNCVTRSLGHLANMVFCWYYGYYAYSRRNLVVDILSLFNDNCPFSYV